jgi:hypothetical protein
MNVLRSFRERGVSLALIVLIMYFVSLMQEVVSYTLVLGRLKSQLWHDLDLFAAAGSSLRGVFLLLMAALWLFKRKRALMRVIVVANTLFTAALLIHTGFLIQVLGGLSSRAAGQLIGDVVLMALSNILIFSIWYWIIDPPGVIEEERDPRPWAFLFPQRGGNLPGYESWSPRYGDYLFVAFTTSFAFSPTDAAPLNRMAKSLMLLQSAISVITLTGIAGSAINVLGSGAS